MPRLGLFSGIRKTVSNYGRKKPQAVDNLSSPTTVYLRKNIQAVEVEDIETGNTRIEYHYDEAAINKDEYIDILRAQIEDNEAVLAEMLFGGEEQ